MATSTIKIYKTPLTPEKNALIGGIFNYFLFNYCTNTYTEHQFQYIKHGLSIEIDIPSEQVHAFEPLGNYITIRNTDDSHEYYYFIIKSNWKSANCISLSLQLDTLNTFCNGEKFQFSEKTSVIREHLPRLKAHNSIDEDNEYRRIIHRVSENIPINTFHDPSKDKESKDSLFERCGNFYLVYRTAKDLTPQNIANPVECFLIADKSLTIKQASGSGATYTLTPDKLTQGIFYYINYEDSPNAKITTFSGSDSLSTTKRVFRINLTSENKIRFAHLNYIKKGDDYFEFSSVGTPTEVSSLNLVNVNNMFLSDYEISGYTDIINLTNKIEVDSGTTTQVSTMKYAELDRTDNRIVKIIKLPYAPDEFAFNNLGIFIFDTNTWKYADRMLKLKNNNFEFKQDISKNSDIFSLKDFKITIPSIDGSELRNDIYESKLFHSDFFQRKVSYGADSYLLKFENFIFSDSNVIPSHISTYFKPTNTINSKFLFHFVVNQYYQSELDYPGFMLTNRNNEVTIYNNAYINYIKNGYNYDKQKLERQNAQNWLGTGIQIAGAVVSGLVGVATGNPFSAVAGVGFGISAINSISSNIIQANENDKNMSQKLNDLRQQSTNISGSDDIDLLDYYNHNCLITMDYQPSPRMKELLCDLFYYCGYSNPVQHIPDIQSRYWFNYLQCNPVFIQLFYDSVSQEIIEDIKIKFANGVTIYHNHGDQWDINQTHENWEYYLVN